VKPGRFLIIIFTLVIFLIPKDNFYAQASQENCCKTESETKSCCDKNKKHHSEESKKEHQSCNDDCCSFCMTCHTFVENNLPKSNFPEISSFQNISKIQVQYIDPFFTNRLKEIWQPPKLV